MGKSPCENLLMPTFLDLFAGVGGLSLGLQRAGWRSVGAVDHWEDAVETYNINIGADEGLVGHRCHQVDVTDLSAVLDIVGERPTWVVGGPPCQGYSTVGRRDSGDQRNQLFLAYRGVVEALRPEGFVIENVVGLKDMSFESRIRSAFEDIGYTTTFQVVRAADFGVPQLRKRVVFVGRLDGNRFGQMRPSHGEDSWNTVWDAIGDLPVVRPGGSVERYDKPPHSALAKDLRDDSDKLTSHVASNHPEHLVNAISHIPDGGNRRSIPPHLQPRSGFHNSYSRLDSSKPAVGVTQNMGKPSATRCIHPFQDRGLTAREGARLQTFPDTFVFARGQTSQRLQIANAVPPLLGEAIGRAILEERSWV
jgi:DNA (cytosine-5)-methyltransferase 1